MRNLRVCLLVFGLVIVAGNTSADPIVHGVWDIQDLTYDGLDHTRLTLDLEFGPSGLLQVVGEIRNSQGGNKLVFGAGKLSEFSGGIAIALTEGFTRLFILLDAPDYGGTIRAIDATTSILGEGTLSLRAAQ